ncbi:MAG: CoA-binding protein [Pseudomonadota bacterium]
MTVKVKPGRGDLERNSRGSMENLDRLFNPGSMALIGASGTPGKWGFNIFLNILKAGYQGVIYPVNPRQESILGFRCYASVRDIPAEIDVAMITTPAGQVSPLIDECGEKGVPYVVVVTSDFSETGPEGARLEKETCSFLQIPSVAIIG